MQSGIRKVDPNLGLHELASSGGGLDSFRFQLEFAKQQIEDILLNLDDLVRNTIDKAPVRKKDFRLRRKTHPPLRHEEAQWERAMWGKWGPVFGVNYFYRSAATISPYRRQLRALRSGVAPLHWCWPEQRIRLCRDAP